VEQHVATDSDHHFALLWPCWSVTEVLLLRQSVDKLEADVRRLQAENSKLLAENTRLVRS